MKKQFNSKGVGLVILTVIILTLGLIIAIILENTNVEIALTKTQKTKNKLKNLRESVQVFVLKHGRFPCPASFTQVPGEAGFGIERRVDQTCDDTVSGIFEYPEDGETKTAFYGAVPVRSLQLSDDYMRDNWGNKIGYVISKRFVEDNAFGDFLKDRDAFKGGVSLGDTIIDNVYVLRSAGRNISDTYGMHSSSGSNIISSGDIIISEAPREIEEIKIIKLTERTVCPTVTNVQVPMYDSDGLIIGPLPMSFNKTTYGEIVYSQETCPKSISDPGESSDYYFKAYASLEAVNPQEINRIGRRCGKNGVWESGFIGVCKKINESCSIPATLNNRAVTWASGSTWVVIEPPPYVSAQIAHTGKISGTFNDNSSSVVLKCNVENDGSANWYVISGTLQVCLNNALPVLFDFYHAIWNTVGTTALGAWANATECETGYYKYDENGPAASAFCTVEGIWNTENPVMPNCQPIICSNEELVTIASSANATWNGEGETAFGETATATGCNTGYSQNPSGLATISCDANGWNVGSITNPCIANCSNADLPDLFYREFDMLFQTHATWNTVGTTAPGETVTATGCNTGYGQNPNGPTTATCGINGHWDDTSVTNLCVACSNADLPTAFANSFRSTWNTTGTTAPGGTATATGCATGYTDSGVRSTTACGANGTWSSLTNRCNPSNCAAQADRQNRVCYYDNGSSSWKCMLLTVSLPATNHNVEIGFYSSGSSPAAQSYNPLWDYTTRAWHQHVWFICCFGNFYTSKFKDWWRHPTLGTWYQCYHPSEVIIPINSICGSSPSSLDSHHNPHIPNSGTGRRTTTTRCYSDRTN
jgi:hypothetical protein